MSVIITNDFYHKGTNGGMLNKAQCLLLGIPFLNNKKIKKQMIGTEISDEVAKRFFELKSKRKTKKRIADARVMRASVLNTKSRDLYSLYDLREFSKKHKLLPQNIRSMKYYQFLKTPYWRSIRKIMLQEAGNKCTNCECKEELVVHHMTYYHHGEEINHMEDLVVLCKWCHNKFHKEHPEIRYGGFKSTYTEGEVNDN